MTPFENTNKSIALRKPSKISRLVRSFGNTPSKFRIRVWKWANQTVLNCCLWWNDPLAFYSSRFGFKFTFFFLLVYSFAYLLMTFRRYLMRCLHPLSIDMQAKKYNLKNFHLTRKILFRFCYRWRRSSRFRTTSWKAIFYVSNLKSKAKLVLF